MPARVLAAEVTCVGDATMSAVDARLHQGDRTPALPARREGAGAELLCQRETGCCPYQ